METGHENEKSINRQNYALNNTHLCQNLHALQESIHAYPLSSGGLGKVMWDLLNANRRESVTLWTWHPYGESLEG